MSRSTWKPIFYSKKIWYLTRLVKKSFKKIKVKYNNFVIHNKSLSIYKIYKFNKVFIHKGLGFKKLKINNFILFKKFGIFVLTKKPFKFPEKKKKKR